MPAAGLIVKPLRSARYAPVGEWEPTGPDIAFPEPCALHITWNDLPWPRPASQPAPPSTHAPRLYVVWKVCDG